MAAKVEALPDGAVSQDSYMIGDEEYTITKFEDGHVQTRCGGKKKKGKKGKWGRK